MWTYATSGMSLESDVEPIELHLFSRTESERHIELLTVVSHYHRTGILLNEGHTVNFGEPWVPGSTCNHGLLSRPYLDGPDLEYLDFGNTRVRFLWLIPITQAELAYKKQFGLQKLEQEFESQSLDYLNPARASAVRI